VSLEPAPAHRAPSPENAGEGWGEGGCLCGAVRYRIGVPPLWVAHCHCSMCRRAQGAAFVTWVGTAEARFSLESGADALRSYRSSPLATRSFCGQCGTPLLFQSSRWPGEVHVTLATLDDASGLAPQAHAYWGGHVDWLGWDGGVLPKVEPEEGDRG
jgi:hypothetical protein